MPRPKASMTAVFFDLDGTLMDHVSAERTAARLLCRHCCEEGLGTFQEEQFCTAWQEASEKHFAQYAEGVTTFQEQRRNRVREVLSRDLADETADALFAWFFQAYEENWEVFPDVLTCLEQLRPSKIGLLSNGEGTQQRRKLEGLGLASAFEPIVISGEVGVSKPDPGIFLETCRRANTEPSHTIYVGDRLETDAMAASEAGLVGIWLNREGYLEEEGVPYQIGSLEELPKTVKMLDEQ